MTLRGLPTTVFPTQPPSERKSDVYCSNSESRQLLWISIGRATAQLADATGITNNRAPCQRAGKVAQSGVPAVPRTVGRRRRGAADATSQTPVQRGTHNAGHAGLGCALAQVSRTAR